MFTLNRLVPVLKYSYRLCVQECTQSSRQGWHPCIWIPAIDNLFQTLSTAYIHVGVHDQYDDLLLIGDSMKVTIYHNPKCSKSRQTLELLQSRGIEPEIIEYLKTPPGKSKLKEILKMLGMEPGELMRRHEDEYKKAKLDNPKLSKDDLIAAMIKYPILIERPIVIANGKAAIGRPPEKVLEIL